MSLRYIVCTFAFLLVCSLQGQDLSKVHIIATGGTIAGVGQKATDGHYIPSKLSVDDLINAVPEIHQIAKVSGEQIFKVSSQDLTDEHHLSLATRVNELLLNDSIQGIVITHGTDTMEETAFFLSLTVRSPKPIVITGAMRASSSLSADGPLNLYNAVALAGSPKAASRGVMLVLNGQILSPKDAVKTNTASVETFTSPNYGALGTVFGGQVGFFSADNFSDTPYFDIKNLKTLPKVGVAYSHVGVKPTSVNAMVKEKYVGIIHIGVGNGNISSSLLPSLERAAKDGVKVVRATRVHSGQVTRMGELDDHTYGFITCSYLNPQKARILLALALTTTSDTHKIQGYFDLF